MFILIFVWKRYCLVKRFLVLACIVLLLFVPVVVAEENRKRGETKETGMVREYAWYGLFVGGPFGPIYLGMGLLMAETLSATTSAKSASSVPFDVQHNGPDPFEDRKTVTGELLKQFGINRVILCGDKKTFINASLYRDIAVSGAEYTYAYSVIPCASETKLVVTLEGPTESKVVDKTVISRAKEYGFSDSFVSTVVYSRLCVETVTVKKCVPLN
jgi:hypothetical protein